MRNVLLALALLGSLALRAQGSITSIPGMPVVGAATTFVLTPTAPPVGAVTWDFGDRTTASGGTVATHVYARVGSYLVRAIYLPFSGQVPFTVQFPVQVANRLGPGAPFALAMLRLRWEDGTTDVSVDQGFPSLAAFADVKYEGTGLLQAQWVVDGVPLGTLSEQLAFAGTATLDSRRTVPLPTLDLGPHLVTLRILTPQATFQPPVIRYFVRRPGEGEAPQVDEVVPDALQAGQEADVWIRGRNLAPGCRVAFGKGVAVVAPLRFTEPGRALARVFVAPTAQPGPRVVAVSSRGGRREGPARLRVLPPPANRNHRPTPLAACLPPGPASRSLLQALAASFILAPGREPAPSLFAVP